MGVDSIPGVPGSGRGPGRGSPGTGESCLSGHCSSCNPSCRSPGSLVWYRRFVIRPGDPLPFPGNPCGTVQETGRQTGRERRRVTLSLGGLPHLEWGPGGNQADRGDDDSRCYYNGKDDACVGEPGYCRQPLLAAVSSRPAPARERGAPHLRQQFSTLAGAPQRGLCGYTTSRALQKRSGSVSGFIQEPGMRCPGLR